MIIIDADGNERDLFWAMRKYNILVLLAPEDKPHWALIKLREVLGPSSMTAKVLSEEGLPIEGIVVTFDWPDGEVSQFTDINGTTGFGIQISSCTLWRNSLIS